MKLGIMTAVDTQSISRILLDDSIKKTYMVPDLTPDEAEKMAGRIISLSADNSRFVRGIYAENTLVGYLNDVDTSAGTIELGWVIHPDYQNKGYCTAAVKAAIEELFSMGYTEVNAGAFPENYASMRVMEKAGMEKIDKTEEVEYRGQVYNCIFYARRKQ